MIRKILIFFGTQSDLFEEKSALLYFDVGSWPYLLTFEEKSNFFPKKPPVFANKWNFPRSGLPTYSGHLTIKKEHYFSVLRTYLNQNRFFASKSCIDS